MRFAEEVYTFTIKGTKTDREAFDGKLEFDTQPFSLALESLVLYPEVPNLVLRTAFAFRHIWEHIGIYLHGEAKFCTLISH